MDDAEIRGSLRALTTATLARMMLDLNSGRLRSVALVPPDGEPAPIERDTLLRLAREEMDRRMAKSASQTGRGT